MVTFRASRFAHQESSDEFVHTDRFGARQLDRAVQRLLDCDVGQRGSDVIRHDGLHHRRRQSNRLAVGGRLGDAADELEELRCADDRVGNQRGLDQVFLGHLRAEVTTGKQTIGADNRQRDVMSHAGGRFGGKEVAPRGLEERQDCLVLERRRVRHVEDDLRHLQALAANPSPVRVLTPEERDAATT